MQNPAADDRRVLKKASLKSLAEFAAAAANRFQSVFATALPRQKHRQASTASPGVVVKRNSLHSASARRRKLHIRSFRFPLTIKAQALIVKRKKEGAKAQFSPCLAETE
jgi:hypothetical protein